MALFLLKPILWNTAGYMRPSGYKVSGGESYPSKHGYGHEEWNASPRLTFTENGQRYRTFHTERVGKAPTEENRGQTFVFMIASHDGVQQLVGIAGNAHYLGWAPKHGTAPYKVERERIARLLEVKSFGEDAWALPRVKQAHSNSRAEFNRHWREEYPWTCNWICPEEFFWWPAKPITLQASRITGKEKLPTMYSMHMDMELRRAEAIMSMVPAIQRGAEWKRLVQAMRVAPTVPVPPIVRENGEPEPKEVTARLTLALARIGQGKFRMELLRIWGGACAVTGVTNSQVLIASHVKPWRNSDNRQRLDPNNGLLLCANLDALFDAYLISFADDGSMLVSEELDATERNRLGLPKNLRTKPNTALKAYLTHHRERFKDRARL
ncbi:HNH endonuclease [Delftia lacustris]|uniref:HNH endonuclease n=2 Tax=Delftia TaxID=80865 RepID=UPI00064053D9|nr:HNH endonuclease [Delftia lacustris]